MTQPHNFCPLFSTPAAGDLDGDGDLEICFKIYGGNGDPADIHLLHHDATPFAGWPKLDLDRSHVSSPVLADVDGDGRLEIFVASNNYTSPYDAVHAWNHAGNPLAGSWPHSAPLCHTDGSAALADVDGGENEVMIGVGGCYTTDNGVMNVWAADGTALDGWPRSVSGFLRSSALVMDSDGDGMPEIYIGSSDGWIHRFLAQVVEDGTEAEWNQIFHDARNMNGYCPEGPAALPATGRTLVRRLVVSPNPFRQAVTIRYALAAGSSVEIAVLDVRGIRIAGLWHGFREPGRHSLTWGGRDDAGCLVPAGIYLLRMETGRSREMRTIQLLR